MEFLDTLETFAEDLYAFVMCECYSISRNMPFYRGSPFHVTMRTTVRHLLKVTEVLSVNLFNDLIGQQWRLTGIRFRKFAIELILEVSKRPYDPFEFLLFATLLCKLAVMCLTSRCGDCSDTVIAALVDVGQRFREKGQFNLPALLRLHKEVRGEPDGRRRRDQPAAPGQEGHRQVLRRSAHHHRRGRQSLRQASHRSGGGLLPFRIYPPCLPLLLRHGHRRGQHLLRARCRRQETERRADHGRRGWGHLHRPVRPPPRVRLFRTDRVDGGHAQGSAGFQ